MRFGPGGLNFRPTPDGGVTIEVGHNATENADHIRSVTFTREEWDAILAVLRPTAAER